MEFIVSKLYKKQIVKDLLKNFTFSNNPFHDRELREEMEQEIYLILLTHPKKKLLRTLYKKGKLPGFVVGIIKNCVKQDRSMFYTKYKDYENRRTDVDIEEERFIIKNNLYYRADYDV